MTKIPKIIYLFFKKHIIFFCLIIFILSFFHKISYVTLSNNWKGGGASDTTDFIAVSNLILEGKWDTNSYDLTFYPAFPIYIALMRHIVGDKLLLSNHKRIFRIISIIIYGLISVLTFLLALHLFSFKIAFLTAPFIILSPSIMFWSHFVLTESIFTFFLLLSIFFISLLLKNTNNKPKIKTYRTTKIFFYSIICGLCFTIASLTRPVLFPLILLIFLWFIIFIKANKNLLKISIISLIIPVILFAFWQIRNKKVTGKSQFLPMKTLSNAFRANYRKHVENLPGKPYDPKKPFNNWDDFINHWNSWSPLKIKLMIKYWLISFKEYWHFKLQGTHQTYKTSTIVLFYNLYYIFTLPLFFLSIFYISKHKKSLSLLWCIIIYFTLVYVFLTFRGGGIATRYRLPIEPYISILAAFSLKYLIDKLINSKKLFL